MNNNAQNGSFCSVTHNQILLTDSDQDAFYHVSNRSPPQWLVLPKSCELIVLRVVREVIIFNNSNFTAVEKTASMRMGGLNPPNPPLATPLLSAID